MQHTNHHGSACPVRVQRALARGSRPSLCAHVPRVGLFAPLPFGDSCACGTGCVHPSSNACAFCPSLRPAHMWHAAPRVSSAVSRLVCCVHLACCTTRLKCSVASRVVRAFRGRCGYGGRPRCAYACRAGRVHLSRGMRVCRVPGHVCVTCSVLRALALLGLRLGAQPLQRRDRLCKRATPVCRAVCHDSSSLSSSLT